MLPESVQYCPQCLQQYKEICLYAKCEGTHGWLWMPCLNRSPVQHLGKYWWTTIQCLFHFSLSHHQISLLTSLDSETLLLRNLMIPTSPQNTKCLSMILSMWNIHRLPQTEIGWLWMRGFWRAARIRTKLSPWKRNKMLAVFRVILALAQKCVSEPCRWGERFLKYLFHLTIACCFQK